MSIESAIKQSGPRLGAWDYNNDALCVYSVTARGAKLLATTDVPADERDAMNDRLAAHGVRIGGTHSNAFGQRKYVWAMDEEGAQIWSESALIYSLVSNIGIRRVKTFFDERNPGHRGVAAEWLAGGDLVIIDEHDLAPGGDPTYNADNLSVDLEWAFYLGRDLAVWRGVPHYDQLTDTVTNEAHLKIRGAAGELAEQVGRAPDIGELAPLICSVAAVGKAAEIALACIPSAGESRRRRLELRVTSTAGRTSVHSLKLGSNTELAAYLRRVHTPSTVLQAMNAALRTLEKGGS